MAVSRRPGRRNAPADRRSPDPSGGGAGAGEPVDATLLAQVLDTGDDVVFVKDREGRHLYVNRAFLDLFGLEAGAVIGRTDEEIYPADSARVFRANDRQVMSGGGRVSLEETLTLSDGVHVFRSLKVPLLDAQGECAGIIGIATDITARRWLDEAFRNAALAVSGVRGEKVFAELVRYLALTLEVDYAFLAVVDDPRAPTTLRTLATHDRGQDAPNTDFDLPGTPCADVVGRQFLFIGDGVARRYPDNEALNRKGYVSYAGFPLFDSRGEPLGLLAVTHRRPLVDRGVTESLMRIFAVRAAVEIERMRAEQARRVSEESYRTIFEASEDAIFVHDFDTGRILDVNPRACADYGLPYSEKARLSLDRLTSDEPGFTADDARGYIERARSGEAVRFEWKRGNRDQGEHWDEVLLQPATIAGERRLLAFGRQITERRQREQALRSSEDRMRATVEAAIDCIIGMDAEGRITAFNPAAERCFGIDSEHAVGRLLCDTIIPPRFRRAHTDGLRRYLETGRGPFLERRIEVQAMRSDGSEFPAELAISVARGGGDSMFIGYLRDITDRRRHESERTRLEAQLGQAQKMEAIGHLTGGIAHDFNNLLTSMMGYVTLAEERLAGHDDARVSRYLDRAKRSGERARDLIQQMLTYSRGQRGEPRTLQLADTVGEALKLIRAAMPSSIEFDLRLDPDVPAVRADPLQVEQVMMNLCINARDAMEGAGCIGVEVAAVSLTDAVCASCRMPVQGDWVALAVSDQGAGIPAEILDRMFEPFVSTKHAGKGSGMGLSMVHGIVHDHGGHVLVDNRAAGARFAVILSPCGDPADDDRDPASAAERERAGGLRGRVLLVDDEESVAEFMHDLLESWGLDVHRELSPAGARSAFYAEPQNFDLVITDQVMPKMTGVTLTQHLRGVRPDLPVLLYTGFSDSLTEEKARASGAHALLRKPLDLEALHRTISELLGRPARARSKGHH